MDYGLSYPITIFGVSYKNTYNRIFYDKIVVKKSKTYGTARRARRAVKLNDNNRCKKRNFQQKKVLVSYFRSDPDIYRLHPLISPPSFMVELVCLWSFNLSKKLSKIKGKFSTKESSGFLFPH